MFIYEKRYTEIWEADKRVARSGMMKLSAWDKRIKVDLFLDHLPFEEQIEGMCYLTYSLERELENNHLSMKVGMPKEDDFQVPDKVEMKWPIVLTHKQSHYTYQRPAKGPIAKIEDCYIRLVGDIVICPIQEEKEMGKRGGGQSEINKREASRDERKDNEIEPEEPRIDAGKVEKIVNDESLNKEKVVIQYIQDLKQLLKMGEPYSDNYYNSFLLHGFYQYRHIVLGNGFLGVPGNFYEREAIAAKMMGFSFFLEKENMQNLNAEMLIPISSVGKLINRKKPEPGTYGYYLKKIPLQEME